MIKVRVYEKQWGGFIADHVRRFNTREELEAFKKSTPHNIEVIEHEHTTVSLDIES